MIRYCLMPKADKAHWLPRMFDLYRENMDTIAPSGLSREDARAQWFAAVSPALDKAPRNVLLCTDDDEFLGYIQYYTRGELLMIEEVQISRSFQRTPLFLALCRRLAAQLPEEVRVIEAYAEIRNSHSQRIMHKLGMTSVPEAGDSPFVHLRGSFPEIRWRISAVV